MSDTYATALIIMARYPEAGKTKTRLARSIGDATALELYQAFLTDLALRFTQSQWRLHWAFTPAAADYAAFLAKLTTFPAARMHCFAQQGPELGARLHAVFAWAQQREYPRTIVIGSDTPHISADIIASAHTALDTAEIVLGPASDGGYYLIAMKEPHDVFSGIPMSTSAVLQMTIERAHQLGLTVQLLEPLLDVDELPDLLRLAALLAHNSALAPTTAARLAAFAFPLMPAQLQPDREPAAL